jgi:hypothetical protein
MLLQNALRQISTTMLMTVPLPQTRPNDGSASSNLLKRGGKKADQHFGEGSES